MTSTNGTATVISTEHQPAYPPATLAADRPRRALDYLADGILLLDSQGEVIYLNPAARRLLAVAEPAPATAWEAILDPGSDAELIHETLAGGPGGEHTAILRTPDGIHTVDMACTPLPPEAEGGASSVWPRTGGPGSNRRSSIERATTRSPAPTTAGNWSSG